MILIGVFLFAQTAALIHSEIHPFHEHTEQCDVFEGVEHQVADAPSVLTLPLEAVTLSLYRSPTTNFNFSTRFGAFQARAPPAFL